MNIFLSLSLLNRIIKWQSSLLVKTIAAIGNCQLPIRLTAIRFFAVVVVVPSPPPPSIVAGHLQLTLNIVQNRAIFNFNCRK